GPGAGADWWQGGSAGGVGGGGPATYGSAAHPTDFGSGGGESPAGGAIRLNVAGNLTLDGQVAANGDDACNGAGSGGSIYITTGALGGSGAVDAYGGDSICGQGGGGGGRIAVYCAHLPHVFLGTTHVDGGSGGTPGAPGTVAFFDTTNPGSTDLYSTGTWRFEAGDPVTYRNVLLSDCVAAYAPALTVAAENFTMEGDSILTAYDRTLPFAPLTLNVANLDLLDTSSIEGNITVDASGYVTIAQNAGIHADGIGHPAQSGAGAGDEWYRGGSYGGRGGSGPDPYGSAVLPADLGSGGGEGAGGGAIFLSVEGTLDVAGTVTANGADACNGAGSGGTINISAGAFAGAGMLAADGGSSGCGQGGGGGGRIAVYYVSGDSPQPAHAAGGDLGGEPGTVGYFKTLGRSPGVNLLAGPTWRFQRNDEGLLAYHDITITNGSAATYEDGSDIEAAGDITVGGAASLSLYSGTLPYLPANLTCANLTVGPSCTLRGNFTIQTSTLIVAPLGAIRADGCGHPTGAGPGAAASWESGGGYGGAGGGSGGGSTYGSAEWPVDPGSGGGSGAGGGGGGVLRIDASGEIAVHGSLSADGVDPGNCHGGGSGGSINLTCYTFSGAGAITANGGTAVCGGFGGGGGRISARYIETLYSGALLALGNNGGADGTVTEFFLPTAGFTASPVVGATPLPVQFTDTSDPGNGMTIVWWEWDFGDATNSTDQNPLHIYQTPGLFTVSLTVTTVAGADTESKTNFIVVNPVVSGTITANGAGLAGVTLVGLPGDPVTGPDGTYGVVLPLHWSGTVTPTLTGSSFSPPSRSYVNLSADTRDQDYTAINPVVSGTVSANGVGLADVTLAGLPGDPVTGPDGLYSAEVPYNWSGTVTPTLAGSTFSPPSREYANLTADAADQDYAAVNPVVSGIVTANGLGLADVTLAGLPGDPVTGPDGLYSVEVPYNWSGTVTPTLAGSTFSPPSREY
ncbi:MAG TPA: PKD domain-containing protein, partial [Candidatus Hydrogenedentes bacterium]|nr:PKD domain-containing protein [Candidatus Hydrogenedentota bacterium]